MDVSSLALWWKVSNVVSNNNFPALNLSLDDFTAQNWLPAFATAVVEDFEVFLKAPWLSLPSSVNISLW